MSKYGILHNNHFNFYHKLKADGSETKRQYVDRKWVAWGRDKTTFYQFDTFAEALEQAEESFENGHYKIVELDSEGNPVKTEEVEKTGWYDEADE